MPSIRTTRLMAFCALWTLLLLPAPARGGEPLRVLDFAALLEEMHDMERLARLPVPAYTTVQFSSYDRRSVSPEGPDWYANSDGFGGEPLPGFAAVLEEPGDDGVGRYLMADVQGPGVIVRGWSAGMGGELRVRLDGSDEPVYEGPAYDFLARRSRIFLERAGVELDCGDAFCQQDADYMPLPFGESLRITWEGKIKELHFYHLEVRRYGEGIAVKTFDPVEDLVEHRAALDQAVERLTRPAAAAGGERFEEQRDLAAGTDWAWDLPWQGKAGAIAELSLTLMAPDLEKALRGTLLRIVFDGAHKAQVEAPAGDFFGSGPGVNLMDSLPMTVNEGGAMTCRFVMPFRERARIFLLNSTDGEVRARASVRVVPWEWNDRSLYFRAKWRTTNLVDTRTGPFDMPYVVARGRGRLVGAACMLVNPSPIPHPYGSWWGEGDEKIFVDDEARPSFYGTGSEDYYNYSWSRPDLFDHPYCGQPLDTGPGNQGYCSNHRWHILDDVPFQDHLAFYMEVWPHSARPGLCYGCIAYLYARPGAIDDHRRIQLSELKVLPVPSMEPEPTYGSRDARFFHFEDLRLEVEGGAIGFDGGQTCASRGRLVTWTGSAGDRIRTAFSLNDEKEMSLSVVAAHWPESGVLRFTLNGTPLRAEDLGGAGMGERGKEAVVFRSPFARRMLSTRLNPLLLKPGEQELIIECVEPGRFGFDYLWIR